MARDENLPFARGQTYYGGTTIDSNNLAGVHLEGKEYVTEDFDLTLATVANGPKAVRTNRYVRLRIVRNKAAAALLPSRLVTYQESGDFGTRVDGYATVTADEVAGVVDEWLPAAGVAVNDLFYIVVEGPTTVLTDLAGGANNLLPIDTTLVALTAATSGATTAGRVAPQDLTGATAVLGAQLQNRLGVACTAKTTANTNALILCQIAKLK